MLVDARPHLTAALEGYTDPVEVEAITAFLAINPTIAAALSFVSDRVVWLFVGEQSQIAIPIELAPVMTAAARERGLLQAFYQELEAEAQATLKKVHATLFPEAE